MLVGNRMELVLLSEIKKARMRGQKEIAHLYEYYRKTINSVIREHEYRLISFEDGLAYKIGLTRDCRTVLGSLEKHQVCSQDLTLCSFKMFLTNLREVCPQDYTFIYSSNVVMNPFVVISLKSFTDIFKVFSDLLEDEFSMINSDSSNSMTINTEYLESMNRISVETKGDKYSQVLRKFSE